ncbi:4Fe-4S ferredoxin [Thermodesulfomicrobium sp. WS]|uniref:ATP-binding protein n=1 Tax=Thermodesulfomicrobium sp. WS TaxID=3004129 RepID=UPI00248F95F9|nr:4Fe-4S binding protein [Thermodesulfomicrobium sp. WS]BDV00531.1 4Fe-4S ferredoxin [Thermodesulfomicrobium sp. WS]
MGHSSAKDIFRALGRKLDQTSVRTPWTPTLRRILTLLYTEAEAELVVAMPHRPSSLARIARITQRTEAELRPLLEGLCAKGLVMDLWDGDTVQYMLSPMVIGFFEFTFMRAPQGLPIRPLAEAFHAYLLGEKAFLEANFGGQEQVSVMRALPHDGTQAPQVTILDHESASAMVREAKRFAIGTCACRHERLHTDGKICAAGLATCTSLGETADFLIRRGFAREVPRQAVEELLARSRELGLVLSTDNVRKAPGFLCHCCACCCHLLRGVRESGYPGVIVSSSLMASVDEARCRRCGRCAQVCPVHAITAPPGEIPRLHEAFCLGCGVCALRCPAQAIHLVSRPKRTLLPEDIFERILLQSLERGTLQHLLFDHPRRLDHAFLRALTGGFLRLPGVKQALMSEVLRSRFLGFLRKHSA